MLLLFVLCFAVRVSVPAVALVLRGCASLCFKGVYSVVALMLWGCFAVLWFEGGAVDRWIGGWIGAAFVGA